MICFHRVPCGCFGDPLSLGQCQEREPVGLFGALEFFGNTSGSKYIHRRVRAIAINLVSRKDTEDFNVVSSTSALALAMAKHLVEEQSPTPWLGKCRLDDVLTTVLQNYSATACHDRRIVHGHVAYREGTCQVDFDFVRHAAALYQSLLFSCDYSLSTAATDQGIVRLPWDRLDFL